MRNKTKMLIGMVLCFVMVQNTVFATNVIQPNTIPAMGYDFKINLTGKKIIVANYHTIEDTRDNIFRDGCKIKINVPMFLCEDKVLEEKLNNEVDNICDEILDDLINSDELLQASKYILSVCDISSVTNKRVKFTLKGKKTLFGGKSKKVNVKFVYDIENEDMEWTRK